MHSDPQPSKVVLRVDTHRVARNQICIMERGRADHGTEQLTKPQASQGDQMLPPCHFTSENRVTGATEDPAPLIEIQHSPSPLCTEGQHHHHLLGLVGLSRAASPRHRGEISKLPGRGLGTQLHGNQ